MTDKLKPCPFCGRFGHEANDQYATGGEYCECEACGIVLKGGAKVWNRRPIEDSLRAELSALKEQNAGCSRALTKLMTEHRKLVEGVEIMLKMNGCFPEHADQLRALLPEPPEVEHD